MAIREFLGKSGDYAAWADQATAKNRTGKFNINFSSQKKLDKMKVSYQLKRHDFDFGCNIFMLDQYETAEENARYLAMWKRVFNTAVVPLYWEGTEPEQGLYRYCEDNGVDMYRRPPAKKAVEYCLKNGITPKGHPLFWHEFIPSWIPRDWNEVLPLVEKRFAEIAELFADDIPVFDVLNEPSRIWDMTFEHATDGYTMVAPPNGYVEQILELGRKYFPNNELILNDAVSASFCDFRGIYSGYYQLSKRLIESGYKVDRIGLQCHTNDDERFKNVFVADRLNSLLNIYGSLGKKVVISEISIPSNIGEDVQAKAVEMLYKVSFSNPHVSGVFWWNLDDNGILKRNIKALRKKGKMGYSSVSELEFYDDSFIETTPDNKSELKYTVVERVSVIADKVIYIHVNNVMSYIIPIACFTSKEQYRDFLSFVQTKCSCIDTY